MYRNHGIPKTSKLNTAAAVDGKLTGQLVALQADGSYSQSVTSEDFALPLINDISKNDESVDYTIAGVAKVFVETAAGITASKSVGIGATGVGIAAFSSGFILGVALETPSADGDYIPVLLTPKLSDSNY